MVNTRLKVQNISIEEKGTCYQITADVGFQQLWFRLPQQFKPNEYDATPFVISALLPAMLLGKDIEVSPDYFVSEQLYHQVEQIQEIYCNWSSSFKKIQIHARLAEQPVQHDCVGSFFSGGVDGTYTMMKHLAELDYLILINGFDFGMGSNTWQGMVERNQEFVEHFDKELLAIETNFKTFILNYGVARSVNYVACLAAIGILLGFKKIYISSASVFSDLSPDACHPLLDHLWGTENVQFIHTGLEADRLKKITFLKQTPYALSNLWVCWHDPKQNCGTCSKCIRTYVALVLNDAENAIKFKRAVDVKRLSSISIASSNDYSFFSNFLVVAKRVNNTKIEKMLNRMLFKYKLKLFLLDCDKYLFNNYFTLKKRKNAGAADLDIKVTLQQRYSDDAMIKQVSKLEKMSDISKNDSIVGTLYFDAPGLEIDTPGEVPDT